MPDSESKPESDPIEESTIISEPEITQSNFESTPEPKSESIVTPTTKSNGKLVGGLVAALVIAAFLGGYSFGNLDNPDAVTKSELEAMLAEMQQNAPTAPMQAQPSVAPPVTVSIDDDPMKGNPDAEVTIVEFSDFQCPFCSRFYRDTLPQIESAYIDTGMVNIVYRDMPLGIHPNALPASVAAECANEQNAFWPYHDILFERQGEWSRLEINPLVEKFTAYAEELNLDSSFSSCLQSSEMIDEVRNDYSDATGLGITGTPTFFVGNSETGYVKLTGAQPFSSFQNVIDSKLG